MVFSLITSNFLTGTNWLNIIRQSAPLLIVATAMTLVITTGGIDLSVGSTTALVGALSAIALNSWGLPWPVVLLGGMVLGGFVGAINGFFIAYEGIPAFIVTLATTAVVRGIALLVTGATRFRCRLTACLPLSDARGSSGSPCPHCSAF